MVLPGYKHLLRAHEKVASRDVAHKQRRQAAIRGMVGIMALLVMLAVVRDSLGVLPSLPRRTLLSEGSDSDDDHCNDVKDWEKNGGFILFFLGALYLFLGIAIICDDFFTPSLEQISEKLNLSEDVAGATFMAAGSSAPELFSSTMSLVSPEANNELGIGTIVGSAVFNILMIIGGTAIFCGKDRLYLDWRPIARDAFFYSASIIGVYFIFEDGEVQYWEGIVSVLLYLGYVLFMCFNQQAMELMERIGGPSKQGGGSGEVEFNDPASGDLESKLTSAAATNGSGKNSVHPEAEMNGGGESEAADTGEEDSDPFSLPDKGTDYPLWLLSLPWYFAFTYTVPDCKPGSKWEMWYMTAFTSSILWISGISYLMVEWCARIGCILDVPDIVMGVTVLAAGTSIPDGLSSIVVAKQGQGDMAVANAVGSNVFDIWLGLGLPWALYLPFVTGMKEEVETGQLSPSIIILFGILMIYLTSIAVNGMALTPNIGRAFIFLYFIYIIYQVVFVWLLDVYDTD